MKMRNLNKQSGISLLEVLLSLSIIAIILVMATRYFFVATNSDRVNMVRQQIGNVISATEAWKGTYSDYNQNGRPDALSIKTLYNDGYLGQPESYNKSSGSLLTPWGNEINVTGGTTAQIAAQLPTQGYCNQLLTSYPDDGASCSSSGLFLINLPITQKSRT